MPDRDRQILFELAEAVGESRPVVLATVVRTHRSAPRHSGTKMLVFGDGETSGTIGGGEMEARVVVEAIEVLSDQRPRMLEYALMDPRSGDPGVCGGEVEIYLEPYMPRHTVYVVGCGHVGRAVVDLAHWIGYRTVAIDDRPEAITAEALPNADERVLGSLANLEREIEENASIVVVTRSVDLDALVVPEALASSARYVGVMGSTTRWRAVAKRLTEAGVQTTDLERVRSPIGIELHAETLEEIAVSILSEVIKVNRSSAEAPEPG
ncbi:MAG: XdhC family protein [Acidimicrobiia bacterium]